MVQGRQRQTASLLPNGEVLLAGGLFQEDCSPACGQGVQATAEVYDPTANTFTAIGNMTIPRESQMSVTLNTGKVLIAGGDDGTNVRGVAELYTP